MKRLQQRALAQSSKLKRWQWILPLSAFLSVLIVWSIYKTEFLAGFWGLLDDEIAIVTIEDSEDGKLSFAIKDPSKSAWDGLGLLGVIAVPVVLAILGAWFQKTQQEQADRIAKKQREQDNQIAEDQRAQDEGKIREEVLQLYFDRVSALLIEKNLMAVTTKREKIENARNKGVFVSPINAEQEELLEVAVNVIRARTLSILRRFDQDPERKGSVIRFLAEAEIIAKLRINLSDADLSGANLRNVDLSRANLSGADLSGADLSRANLSRANLRGASLYKACLRKADLRRARLRDAYLIEADLSRANLDRALLGRAYLDKANLSESSLRRANLRGAGLGGAVLSGASLDRADLRKAILNRAVLTKVNLSGANLSEASLRGAYLNKTDLSEAILNKADLDEVIVEDALFIGIEETTEAMKRYSSQRGTVFDRE